MYFNRVNKRTGALFQSRFKSKYANNDIYLRYLFAYIHLNPIKIVDSNWKEKGISNIKKAKMFLQPGTACPTGLVAAFVEAREGAHAPLTVERVDGRLRVFFRWDEHGDAAWIAGDVEAAVRLQRASERP